MANNKGYLKDRNDNKLLIDSYHDITTESSSYIEFSNTPAGKSGYKTFTITIPKGYLGVFCGFSAADGQVGALNGLQVTVVYNPMINGTGAQTTGYINYYAPQEITSAADIRYGIIVNYFCIKNNTVI